MKLPEQFEEHEAIFEGLGRVSVKARRFRSCVKLDYSRFLQNCYQQKSFITNQSNFVLFFEVKE